MFKSYAIGTIYLLRTAETYAHHCMGKGANAFADCACRGGGAAEHIPSLTVE